MSDKPTEQRSADELRWLYHKILVGIVSTGFIIVSGLQSWVLYNSIEHGNRLTAIERELELRVSEGSINHQQVMDKLAAHDRQFQELGTAITQLQLKQAVRTP